MPDNTSCACSGTICTECFLLDFRERQRLHYVHVEGETGDVAKCDDRSPPAEIMFMEFYSDYYDASHESLLDVCYRGRRCPFCRVLQLWNYGETPRIRGGNRLTFWSAAINWNATD